MSREMLSRRPKKAFEHIISIIVRENMLVDDLQCASAFAIRNRIISLVIAPALPVSENKNRSIRLMYALIEAPFLTLLRA